MVYWGKLDSGACTAKTVKTARKARDTYLSYCQFMLLYPQYMYIIEDIQEEEKQMRKYRTAIVLLLFISIFVHFHSALATGEVSLSALEERLQNGANSPKDIQIMLENAWLNGYDYCKISQSKDKESFVIEIAVRGLTASLKTLAKSEGEQAPSLLMQARSTFLSQCQEIINLMDANNIPTAHFSFALMDDIRVLQNEYATSAVVASVTVCDGIPVQIESIFEAWNTPLSSEPLVTSTNTITTRSTIEKLEPTYILNTNSKKFHIPTCDSVMRIKEKNRQEFFGQRDELTSRGYVPCGSCNP